MGIENVRQVWVNPVASPISPIFCFDDFEGGLLWQTDADEAGATVSISDSTPFNDTHCLLLEHDPAAFSEDTELAAFRNLSITASKLVRFSAWFYAATWELHKEIQFRFYYCFADILYEAVLSYFPNQPYWKIYHGETPEALALPGTAVTLFPACWHNISFSVDLTTGKWIDVQIDHLSIDVSSYDLYSEIGSNAIGGFVEVRSISAGTLKPSIYIDQFNLCSTP